MAKKYLLYIHEELFAKEPKKSQLINNLLERHYHDTVGGLSQEEINDDLEMKIGLKPPPVAIKPKIIKTPEDVKKKVTKPSNDYCKHGFALSNRMCKFGCR